jgi:hypothetical protein
MQVFSEAGVIIFQLAFSEAFILHKALLNWHLKDEINMRIIFDFSNNY